MKVRESGMPDEKMWEEFFNPGNTLKTMGINGEIKDIVDFGCGYGTFTIPAAKMVERKGKVYAVDIEPEMIEITRKKARENKLSNVETILCDFMSECSGLENESVDYVMLFNILHAEQPEKLLQEAYRILKPNGKIGIMHWKYQETPRGPSMEIRPKPEQVIEWATNANFNNPIRHDLRPYHYGIVMNKINKHYIHDWTI